MPHLKLKDRSFANEKAIGDGLYGRGFATIMAMCANQIFNHLINTLKRKNVETT